MCRTLLPYLHDLPAGPIVSYGGRALKTIQSTFDRLKVRVRTELHDEAARINRRSRRVNAREEVWSGITGAKMRGDALLALTLDAIRHTVACEMRKRGVPVYEVAGFLGHSSGYRTTERYAKYDPDHLGKAVRAIDAYFANLGVADGRAQTRLLASRVLMVIQA
jgi:integrase